MNHPNIDRPVYPPLAQLLRVTSATVPGPTGYASASILAPNLYVSFTQQLRTGTILPRDREPCLALDTNGLNLQAGYYIGRLAGSYDALPVYEIGGFPGWATGLTPDQVNELVTTVPRPQIELLSGLDPPQLQSLLSSLDTPQLQTLLSTGLTSAQLQNLLATVPTAGIPLQQSFLTTLTGPQLQQLGANLTREQLTGLLRAMTVAEMRLLAGLSTPRLQALQFYPIPVIAALLRQLPFPEFEAFLQADVELNAVRPNPVLGDQDRFPFMPVIEGEPSSVLENVPEGYVPFVADENGNLYILDENGTWTQVGSSGGAVAGGLAWEKFTVTHDLLHAPNTTHTFTFSFAAVKKIVHMVVIKTSVRFTGGTLSGYRLSVGYTAPNFDQYIQLYDAFVASSGTHDDVKIADATNVRTQLVHSGTLVDIVLLATATGGFTNATTQGSVDVWFLMSTLP